MKIKEPLVTGGQEWSFELLDEVYLHIQRIATEKYKLDVYPNQLEIISSEQMLDAYASVGLPVYYTHWSFGQKFIQQHEQYKRGQMGLAYEIVINSSPCIAYLMEENTMMMQTLVTAHASFGHNYFFKNNYLFKQWTDAEGIIDYLLFAKRYIRECEEKYGVDEVEAVLDAAHSLNHYGVDKYSRPVKMSAAEEENLRKERDQYIQSQLNQIWNTIPKTRIDEVEEEIIHFPAEPQENILYFIEKHAPRMETWKREIIRIVRKIAQYFYPQMQTQVMNEGCATYFHYKIMSDLYEEGILDDGAWLEFISSHTNVIKQPEFDETVKTKKGEVNIYSGINPYALGFAMMMDIERIAMDPTEEDIEWFKDQEWVGSGDYVGAVQHAIQNYKDESFIQQYLSPKVMRDFRFFAIIDDEIDPKLEISGIHNRQGYKTIRSALSESKNLGHLLPDIQVTDVDRWGDRSLTLKHFMVNGRRLDAKSAIQTLEKISYLWGYNVKLESMDGDKITAVYAIEDDEKLLDIFEDDD
mgnify:CR=1 FL=1